MSSALFRGMRLDQLPAQLSVERPYDVLELLLHELPIQYASKDPSNIVPEALIVSIVRCARELFMTEPIVVNVEPPVYICGDIHGQYYDLVNIFSRRPPLGGKFFSDFTPKGSGPGDPGDATEPAAAKKARTEDSDTPELDVFGYLFLGDYVDRGTRSIEVMITLLALKILSPKKMHILRGNHETEGISMIYGFFDECKRRYSVGLYNVFVDLFKTMPISAVVGGSICCMHGGISPELMHISAMRDSRPCTVGNSGVLCDFLWSDPNQAAGPKGKWAPNDRGVSYFFSETALEEFLAENDFDLVCRAHQVVQHGYQFYPSGADRRLVTIFSATNYCSEFENRGGMMVVDKNMKCSFLTFTPPTQEQKGIIRTLHTFSAEEVFRRIRRRD
jgi:serine/threonine-protein phosphatase PP1 catalytic subunit